MCVVIYSVQYTKLSRKHFKQKPVGISQIHWVKRQYRLNQAVVPLCFSTENMGRNYRPSTGLLPCCSQYSMFIKRKWSGRRAEVPLEAVVPPDFGGSTAWDFKCKIERNYRSSTVTLPCSSRYNENIKRYSSGTSVVVPPEAVVPLHPSGSTA